MADIGEEEAMIDGDVGGVLVGGGVGGALIGVPFLTHMGIVALLLVVPLLFLLLSLLVLAPVTITRHWTFSNKMTGLTTFVAHPLGAGFVVFPPPFLEDLAEALDDERHFLVVELGGVDGKLKQYDELKNLSLCGFLTICFKGRDETEADNCIRKILWQDEYLQQR